MAAINCVTKLPVIRPVACLDKLDIIEIAKNIDTYETSILPFYVEDFQNRQLQF